MSEMIGKTSGAAKALMEEVEALFEMSVEQRRCVQLAIDAATSPKNPDWTYETFYDEAHLDECRIAGQPIHAEDCTDGDGNPDGGFVEGCGLSIRWQRGALDKDEVPPWNGAFPVTVLEAVLYRLEYYQNGKFACQDNNKAICHIREAIDVLNKRQIERFCRGGT